MQQRSICGSTKEMETFTACTNAFFVREAQSSYLIYELTALPRNSVCSQFRTFITNWGDTERTITDERETEVNSHVSESSEDNRYLESKGGEEIVQNHSQQRNQTGSCATALTVRTEEEKKPAPSRKRYGEKLISRPESGDPCVRTRI